jgi:hypothetical protein
MKAMLHPALDQALSKLKPSNHLQNRVIYLQSPIGNSDYIANTLMEAAKHFNIKFKAIQNQLEDLQTQMVLFSKCLLPSIPHLLATDVLLHFPSFHDDFDPFFWTSPFIKLLQSSTAALIFSSRHMKCCPICTHGTSHIFQYHLVALGFKTFQPEPLLLLLYPLLALYVICLKDFLSKILNLSCAHPRLL